MDEPVVSASESTGMSAFVKAVLLVIGAGIITMVVVAFVVALAVVFVLVESPDCSTVGDVLLVAWVAIAAVLLTSVVLVGAVAKRIVGNGAGRWVIVAVCGVLALVSFVVVAFGLMVLFNC